MKAAIVFLTTFFFLIQYALGSRFLMTAPAATGGPGGSFDVKQFGAKGDGKSDDCKAFEAAWKAACAASGTPKLLIPKGTFLVGQVKFNGPCPNAQTITVQLEGTVLASTNLGQYAPGFDWFNFDSIKGLVITGGGTFDGQGATAWPQNKCPKTANCKTLPASLKFNGVTDSSVKGITSLNSKQFHVSMIKCQNFDISGLKITAPETSPNTDGIHIDRCSGVTISNTAIGTGDDCISFGSGNLHVTILGVTCGPGHGISIGSLGKYDNEEDLNGILVKNCTITGTMFGARIKSWEGSKKAIVASNITFEDITMNNVANPIFVDQTYCPFASCSALGSANVKLQDIFFRNIKGTSSTPQAVTIECAKGIPCTNVVIENVHLQHTSGAKVTSMCTNSKPKFVMTQFPPACP